MRMPESTEALPEARHFSANHFGVWSKNGEGKAAGVGCLNAQKGGACQRGNQSGKWSPHGHRPRTGGSWFLPTMAPTRTSSTRSGCWPFQLGAARGKVR